MTTNQKKRVSNSSYHLPVTVERFSVVLAALLFTIAWSGPGAAQSSQKYEILDSQFTLGSSGDAVSENFSVSAIVGQSSPSGNVASESYAADSGNPRLAIGQLLNRMDIDRVDIKWDKSEFNLKAKLELPFGVSPQTVAPEGRVVVGISSLGAVLDENIVMAVEGDDANKWEYKNKSVVFGIRKMKIDWKGAQFSYNFGGLSLKSRHIGASSTTFDISFDVLAVTSARIELADIAFVVTRNGSVTIVANPSGNSIIVDTDDGTEIEDGEEIEVELPFALTPDMALTVTVGSMTDTSLAGDHMTTAVGHLNVKAKFDSANVNVSLLSPTFATQIILGKRLYSGSDTLDAGAWKKLKINRWKYD